MEYNKYRKLIKERKSIDEIKSIIGEPINHHPKGKFKYGKLLPYNNFLYEIKFQPKEIEYVTKYENSYFFENLKNIVIDFDINDIDYVLFLQCFIENNISFKDKIIYNISFTTKEKYLIYKEKLEQILNEQGFILEDDIVLLKHIFEKETNYGNIIQIFNALSYILINLSMSIIKNEGYCIYMIGETDNIQKIDFYKKSIESSFKNYKLSRDYSQYYSKLCYYYEI